MVALGILLPRLAIVSMVVALPPEELIARTDTIVFGGVLHDRVLVGPG